MPTDVEQLQALVMQLQRELWQARAHIAARELVILDLAERDMQKSEAPNE